MVAHLDPAVSLFKKLQVQQRSLTVLIFALQHFSIVYVIPNSLEAYCLCGLPLCLLPLTDL